MSNYPLVVVEAPNDIGLRAVRVRGETVGRVWSQRGLRRLLRRVGLPPDIDLDDPGRVHWIADKSCWPDRRWQRRAAGVLMALGLLASAAVLFYVGMTDAFNALAYGGRIVGAVFVAAALVEMVSFLAVCDYWRKRAVRYSGAAVLVGVGTVTATNLMFLITQIQGRSYTQFLWLWIALALWTAWALWMLTRRKAWQGIPYPKSFALSVVVSGLIGLASLTYSQMYVPYATPVRVPFGVSFGDPTVSADGASLHVPAHLEFRNAGSVRIYVVGTMWTIKGYPTKFTTEGSGMNEWKRDLTGNRESSLRHVRYSPSRMLGVGEIVDAGGRLDPGADFSKDITVDIPLKTEIGRIQVDATVSFIRADRCKLGNDYGNSFEASWDTNSKGEKHIWNAPAWLAGPKDEFYRYHSKVYHSSEMLNLTHATDYAAAWWVLPRWTEGSEFANGDTDPFMVPTISRDPEGEERLSDSQQEPYGMTTYSKDAELTVEQLLKAAKK